MAKFARIAPYELTDSEWKRILDLDWSRMNPEYLAFLRKLEASANKPQKIEGDLRLTTAVNNKLRRDDIPFRLYSPQRGRRGSDIQKEWLMGITRNSNRSPEIFEEAARLTIVELLDAEFLQQVINDDRFQKSAINTVRIVFEDFCSRHGLALKTTTFRELLEHEEFDFAQFSHCIGCGTVCKSYLERLFAALGAKDMLYSQKSNLTKQQQTVLKMIST